jgi:hypothetical protein
MTPISVLTGMFRILFGEEMTLRHDLVIRVGLSNAALEEQNFANLTHNDLQKSRSYRQLRAPC